MNIDIDRTARIFKALASPQRLALFERLRKANSQCRSGQTGEMCVCEVADGVDLTLSTVSHHLKELKEAGLVRCERRGQWVYCAVNVEALSEIEAFAQSPSVTPRRAKQA